MVNYIYDVWGNHAVLDANGADITDPNHIGVLNPFRYRGYFYDVETGLYYLQTRYYDPEIGRFITIDGIEYLDPETINGLNLYAYCGNNPVMNVDSIGTDWNSFWSDVGNWFNKAGNRIKDFFVEDVYGKIIKPTWNWISGVAATSVSNFFANTIPTFFNTTLPNWWNKIKMTVGQWTWKEIINPMWNFIVQTVPNSLASAWNWISNNWKTVVDVASGALSIGSGIVGILAAVGVFSIPVVGQIILGIVSIGGGIYSMGSAFSWW